MNLSYCFSSKSSSWGSSPLAEIGFSSLILVGYITTTSLVDSISPTVICWLVIMLTSVYFLLNLGLLFDWSFLSWERVCISTFYSWFFNRHKSLVDFVILLLHIYSWKLLFRLFKCLYLVIALHCTSLSIRTDWVCYWPD